MDARRKAAGHQHAIAAQGLGRSDLTRCNDRGNIGPLDAKLADCAGDGIAFLDLQASGLGRLDQRTNGIGPRIDNRGDLDACLVQIQSRPIGLIMAGGNHHPLAGFDAIAVQIDAGRIGQEHAGTVIVWEDQRTLDGTRRQHHFAGTDLPQTLTRGTGSRMGLMLAETLGNADHIVREIAKGVGAADQGNLRIGHQGG